MQIFIFLNVFLAGMLCVLGLVAFGNQHRGMLTMWKRVAIEWAVGAACGLVLCMGPLLDLAIRH